MRPSSVLSHWATAILATVLILASPAAIFAQSAPKYSNEFLAIGVGARGLAMGKAMQAVASDATAAYWNPAGLLGIGESGQLGLMHASYFAGIANLDFAGLALPIAGKRPSALALSIVRFGIDGIPDTRFLFTSDGRLDYSQVSSFTAADYAFAASYARPLDDAGRWRLGGSLKVVHRSAGAFANAWGAGLDAGLQYNGTRWKWGIMARDITTTYNVWSVNSQELEAVFLQTGNDIPVQRTEITLPRLQAGGARRIELAKQLEALIAFGADFTFDGQRNTLLGSPVVSVDPYAGLELGYRERVYIRAGIGQFQQFQEQLDAQLSFGMGLKFKSVAIDYALASIGAATSGLYSHVFSLSFRLKKKEE
jgi:hypothetical protein